MRFSTRWIRDYLEGFSASDQELARALTDAGFAVELIEPFEDDTVFDIDLTTNRVDAMNHLGLAREVATLFRCDLKAPSFEGDEGSGEVGVEVAIEAPALCSRYTARVIRGVKVGPSPDWLKQRLGAIGVRSINNVVDVTNFVLWETGQPLHAFDLAHLRGGAIRVRRPQAGEKLVTLDGVERELDGEVPIIADAEGSIALGGVMGGEASEVGDETTDILLESAWFDPLAIRRSGKLFGLHTDASHRFERGVDPELALRGSHRAARLIVELAGGELVGSAIDAVVPEPGWPEPARITFRPQRLDRFAGVEIPRQDSLRFLRALGFAVGESDSDAWKVTTPSWRRWDVLEEADLFEEAMRLFGFDSIPADLPAIGRPDAPESMPHRRRRLVRETLVACGLAESIHWAFHSRPADRSCGGLHEREDPVVVANPVSELYSVLRRSLLPGLVAAADLNLRHGARTVRLFEIGHVFWQAEAEGEAEHLGWVVGGDSGARWTGARELDFFDAKGIAEAAARQLGLGLEARTAEIEGLQPGVTATLHRVGPDRVVGVVGKWSDAEMGELFVGELDLTTLPLADRPDPIEVPTRLPGVVVDATLTHPDRITWSEIRQAVFELAPENLVRVDLEDLYRGQGVPEGCVNTTLRFEYNAGDRSLTQDEVNATQGRVTAELEKRFAR